MDRHHHNNANRAGLAALELARVAPAGLASLGAAGAAPAGLRPLHKDETRELGSGAGFKDQCKTDMTIVTELAADRKGFATPPTHFNLDGVAPMELPDASLLAIQGNWSRLLQDATAASRSVPQIGVSGARTPNGARQMIAAAVTRTLATVATMRSRVAIQLWIAEYGLVQARDIHIAFSRHWRTALCSVALGLLATLGQSDR